MEKGTKVNVARKELHTIFASEIGQERGKGGRQDGVVYLNEQTSLPSLTLARLSQASGCLSDPRKLQRDALGKG